MTYGRAENLVEDACWHIGIAKQATEYLKDALGKDLVKVHKRKGQYKKTWWYTIRTNDKGIVMIAYDFGTMRLL